MYLAQFPRLPFYGAHLYTTVTLPVLVPDVQPHEQDDDDDGRQQDHAHDEEGGAGDGGAVGEGGSRALTPTLTTNPEAIFLDIAMGAMTPKRESKLELVMSTYICRYIQTPA